MTSIRKHSAHRLSHDVGHALVIHAGAHEGATDLQHSELTGHQFGIVGGLTTTEIAAAFLVPGATMAAPGPMVTLSRAVALALVHGPKAGLALLGALRAGAAGAVRWRGRLTAPVRAGP